MLATPSPTSAPMSAPSSSNKTAASLFADTRPFPATSTSLLSPSSSPSSLTMLTIPVDAPHPSNLTIDPAFFSKTKEEMLQSAPEEPIRSPRTLTRTNYEDRPPGVFPQKFHWKHGGEVVKVTGTFDGWKETIVLEKLHSTRDEYFSIVDLDRTEDIVFKFVVDGVWRCSTEFETISDIGGNVNNILYAINPNCKRTQGE